MNNPFSFKEIPVTAPFCDRETELEMLYSHALNKANIVLYSPRRYGKTSLVKRLQARLAKNDCLPIYVDFYGINSVESVAERLVAKLYSFCHKDENLFKKAIRFITLWRPVLKPDADSGLALTVEPTADRKGTEVLDQTLTELGKFTAEHNATFHIVLDEFQEITELRESQQIEGIMRSHIQAHQNVSYFFVGSRRRILLDLFNNRKRAFYKSTINFELKPLPEREAVAFIMDRFKAGGKNCSTEIAKLIYGKIAGYPYYIQRMPYTIYEIARKDKITRDDYNKGFLQMIAEEKPLYEAMFNTLSVQQLSLFYALAAETTDSPFSMAYMTKHKLTSFGGVQGALKRLLALDYIEKRDDGKYVLVDPVFAVWALTLKS